eukprot:CAMPEP_0184752708 /NCGR_PEP_ID=MMETSP0315-20130426/43724_1 /TAXON_ID=101924 /ORGANISM="Rhodosorus marinus, Strain UTEX LB 2760" /LENGTH=281 /DNA_ID=CAMNT_0027232059 /DNA_START=201 /DNA_END=1046 /DNA_ORIENTATION=-
MAADFGMKMENRRHSRLRALIYFCALGLMVATLMILQLPRGTDLGSESSITTIESATTEGHPYSPQRDTATATEPQDEDAFKEEKVATLEELQDEVDELFETVDESAEDRSESEKSLAKLMAEGDEVPDYTNSSDETGDGDEIPLAERFKAATLLYDSMHEKSELSLDSIMRLQALELQSILGDCGTQSDSGELFKSEMEQRAEQINVEENTDLETLWCSLRGIQKRDAMRAYIKRVQALNAPHEELQNIMQMQHEYEEYLGQKQQEDISVLDATAQRVVE